jgi:hypothetical protein
MLGTAALIERAVVQHVLDGDQHRGGNYADGLWGSAATMQASKRRGAHNWRCLSRARRISDCTSPFWRPRIGEPACVRPLPC